MPGFLVKECNRKNNGFTRFRIADIRLNPHFNRPSYFPWIVGTMEEMEPRIVIRLGHQGIQIWSPNRHVAILASHTFF